MALNKLPMELMRCQATGCGKTGDAVLLNWTHQRLCREHFKDTRPKDYKRRQEDARRKRA